MGKLPVRDHNGINYSGNKGPKFGAHHVQIVIMAMGVSLGFASKSMLSVAIVAMTANSTSNPDVPTYKWDNTSVIISAILWSGIAVNVLAGYLGKRFGPKWFIVGSSLFNNIWFMLIPTSASIGGSTGVIVCRIFQGVALGFLFPLNGVIMGRWVPPEERSRMAFVGGGFITTLVTISSISTGYIADSYMGWPWVFYIFGIIGLIWTVLYAIMGVQSVEAHSRMDPDEKKYLQDTLFDSTDNQKIPWLKIFTSIHFWAIVIGVSGNYWIVVMLSTEMSIFLAKVMQFDVKTNGTVSAIPPLVGAVTGIFTSILSDYIPKTGILSLLNSRRIFHLTGMIGISLCLVLTTFVPVEQRSWSVVLLCIGNVFVMAPAVGGANTNILDVSPKYAGVIMGFVQMLSQILALFAPLVVQWVCTEEGDPSQWRTVFLISAAIALVTAIFFVYFATDRRQNWDEETEKEAQMERQKRKSSIISISAGIGP